MEFFGTNFWISFLILAGIIIVASQLLNFKITILRILFGVFFILTGLSIVFNGFSVTGDSNTIFFHSQNIVGSDNVKEYDIVFGSGTIDLSGIQPGNGVNRIEVDTIFGSSNIIINKNTPVTVKGNCAFGSLHLPDGSSSSFGTRTYQSGEGNTQALTVEVNSIFSSVDVQEVGND